MSEQKRKLTIAETLLASELPEDVKAAAIANHRVLGERIGWEAAQVPEDCSASFALDCAFSWDRSEEGLRYWDDWWQFLFKKECDHYYDASH